MPESKAITKQYKVGQKVKLSEKHEISTENKDSSAIFYTVIGILIGLILAGLGFLTYKQNFPLTCPFKKQEKVITTKPTVKQEEKIQWETYKVEPKDSHYFYIKYPKGTKIEKKMENEISTTYTFTYNSKDYKVELVLEEWVGIGSVDHSSFGDSCIIAGSNYWGITRSLAKDTKDQKEYVYGLIYDGGYYSPLALKNMIVSAKISGKNLQEAQRVLDTMITSAIESVYPPLKILDKPIALKAFIKNGLVFVRKKNVPCPAPKPETYITLQPKIQGKVSPIVVSLSPYEDYAGVIYDIDKAVVVQIYDLNTLKPIECGGKTYFKLNAMTNIKWINSFTVVFYDMEGGTTECNVKTHKIEKTKRIFEYQNLWD